MPDGPSDELTLHEVARRLGVHYMTAYRYVRTGQLPARRDHGEWRVRGADVERFSRRGADRKPSRGRPQWSRHVRRIRDRIVNGDESGAWQVLDRALASGAEPAELYVRVLAPALREVGDAWERRELTVEDEHRATGVASRLIGRLGPLFARPGRTRGTLVIGAAPGDSHSLPAAMVGDVLRGEHYAVVELGGSTPAESFVSAAAAADDLVAVGVSASTAESLVEARRVIDAVHEALPGVPTLLGGPAVDSRELALQAGADGWAPDALHAVALVEGLRR